MSTEVGQGHIDIEPRIDDTTFVRQSRALTQTAEKQWGLYAKNASRAMRETDEQFKVSSNKQIAAWQALDRQRKSFEADRSKAATRHMAEISRETQARKRLADSDIAAGARAAAEYERSQMAAFDRVADGHTKTLQKMESQHSRTAQRVTVDVDRHSHRWGTIVANNLTNGFEAAISIMPGRMEGIFTRTGPLIGTVLIAGITQAIIFAAPALGAMLSGLIFTGIGFGGIIAAGIIGALDDNRVKEAGARFVDTFKNKILYADTTQIIGERLAGAIDIATNRLSAFSAEVNSILVASSTQFNRIVIGVAEAFSELIGPMDRFFNSDFFSGLITITLNGFIQLTNAVGEWIDKFMETPGAVEGARLGLQDFFDILTAGLSGALDILTKLSVKWNEMNSDPDGMGPKKSEVETWKDFISEIKTLLGLLDKLGSNPGMMGLIGGSASMQNEKEGGRGGFAGAHEKYRETISKSSQMIQENPQGNIPRMLSGPGTIAAFEKGKVLWADFMTDIKEEWAVAGRNWDAFTSGVSTRWTAMVDGLKNTWNTAWGFIKMVFVNAWNSIVAFLQNNWFIQFFISAHIIIQEIMAKIFGVIVGTWLNVQIWTQNLWSTIFTNVWGWLQSVWDSVTNWFVRIWQTIVEKTAGIRQSIWDWLSGVWQAVTSWFASIWNSIVSWWNSITSSTSSSTTGIRAMIDSWLAAVAQRFTEVWEGIRNFMSTAWNNIKNAVATGINGVIGIINKGIEKINELLGKIGVDKKLPLIGEVGIGGPKVATSAMATGGRVRGPGTGTSDSVPAVLSNGEFVIRANSAKQLGYQNLSYMNSMGRVPGFAAGGRVGGENEGLLQQHANHLHVAMNEGFQYIIALAAKSGIPNSPGSTVRPGDTTASGSLSWHSSGKAVDFMGYNQDALAQFFMGVPGVLELIHRTGIQDYTIFGGKGGGAPSFLMEILTKGLDHFLDPIINGLKGKMPNTPFGWIAGAAIDKVKGGVKGMVDSFLQSFREVVSGGGGGGGAGQWSGVASHALSLLGLPGSWLGPLLTLIDRESGGNPRSINNYDSNAAMGDPSRGLMQTIGSTFNAHRLPSLSSDIYDPLSNIVAGLRYIQSRYGSIFNVQQAVGSTPAGYDNGGPWASGTLGINESGRTEMVLNGAQAQALENRIAGDGSGYSPTIIVMVDGVEVAYRAVIEESNNQVSRGFRGGRK